MYAFANGNPVSYIDPFGLGAVGENASSSWLSTYNSFASVIVPGQTAWNSAVSAFQNGNYGTAALDTLNMLGQQALFVATLGGSEEATPLLNSVDNSALAGSIRNVNPTGGTMNCVNCSIASDATLAGNAASALPGGASSIGVLERTFSGSFQPVSGQMQIGSILSQSGNGARGIVFGESLSGDVGHVFNAINRSGTIQFLDGQIGGSGLNNFNNFQNFQFLLTHP